MYLWVFTFVPCCTSGGGGDPSFCLFSNIAHKLQTIKVSSAHAHIFLHMTTDKKQNKKKAEETIVGKRLNHFLCAGFILAADSPPTVRRSTFFCRRSA